jgi:hypothetical protein
MFRSALTILKTLAMEDKEPVAILADALIPAVSNAARAVKEKPFDRIREVVAALSAAASARGQGPSAIIDALVEIDEALGKCADLEIPFAARLASLAAECAVHATQRDVEETFSSRLAESAPIVAGFEQMLLVAPMAEMGEEGLARYADRVLAAVMKQRPKKVAVVVGQNLSRAPKALQCLEALEADLAEQGIEVKRISTL